MKRFTIIFLCILMIVMSGCKKKNTKEPEPSIIPTETVDTPTPTIADSESTLLTVTPMPTPVVVGNPKYTFQVQPITIPQNMTVPHMSKEEFPILDGSTANIPLGEAIYCYLTGATSEEAKADLKFNKTSGSYEKLLNKESDLLFVYEPSQTTLAELQEQHAEFEFKPLGRDALVFIENEGNTVDSLTKEQITDIYSGKITNWSEVGGANQEILPFQRPAKSGSQSLMEKLAVSADDIMNGPEVIRPTEMGDLIDVLASYNNEGNALGYSVFFYANYMYSKPGLKFVAIDGVMPTNETIQKCEYPYVNEFYVVIRKDEPTDSNARKIYDWMTSIEAQTILTDAGYVPVIDVLSSNKQSTEPYGVEINGSMNIGEHQYIVLHNVTSEETFLGDSLLDRNLNTVMTFPGKYIDKENDLLCKEDEILLIESYKQLEDSTGINYELYSLAKHDFLSNDLYTYIQKTDEGFLTCYGYDETTEKESVTIFDPNGNLVKKVDNMNWSNYLEAVKNHVAHLQDMTLTFYDQTGKELSSTKLPYDSAYISESSDWNHYDTQYLWVIVNDTYKIIFDSDGTQISNESFLSNYMKKDQIPELWITDSIVANDGHLYASGNIDGTLILARDDGTIVYQMDNPEETYNISLYCNLFAIYDMVGDIQQVYTYDGVALSSKDKIMSTNDAYVICKKDGFEVYSRDQDLNYKVKETNYIENSFFTTEGMTIPEAKQYIVLNKSKQETYRTSFLGIRTFDDYVGITKVGDYYIVFSSDEDGTVHQSLMDSKGMDLYVGEPDERITQLVLGDDIYIYVEKGNYSGIKNTKGEYLYRQYANQLGDD